MTMLLKTVASPWASPAMRGAAGHGRLQARLRGIL